MKTSPRILTREQQLARLARKTRWALAVYFSTGVLPPLPSPGLLLQTTSATSPNALYACQQKGHRS